MGCDCGPDVNMETYGFPTMPTLEWDTTSFIAGILGGALILVLMTKMWSGR